MKNRAAELLLFLILFLLIPSTWAETSPILLNAESIALANIAKVNSGSCAYSISAIHPKYNLMAYPSVQPDGTPYEMIKGDKDAVLEGVGWFKWQGSSFVCGSSRVQPTMRSGAVGTGIYEQVESLHNSLNRVLTQKYLALKDFRTETVRLTDKNFESVEVLCTEGNVEPQLFASLPFSGLKIFSSALEARPTIYADHYQSIVSEEGDLITLSDSRGKKTVLNKQMACMPVSFTVGNPAFSIRKIEYTNYDGVWFPTKTILEKFNSEEMMYLAAMTITSVEFNKTYPEQDFEIIFPEGHEVKKLSMAE